MEELDGLALRGLARLFPQQRAEPRLVGLDGVGELEQVLRAVVRRPLAPLEERRLARCHGAVDVRLRRDGHLGQGLARAGIHGPAGLRRGGELVVDHIAEGFLAAGKESELAILARNVL